MPKNQHKHYMLAPKPIPGLTDIERDILYVMNEAYQGESYQSTMEHDIISESGPWQLQNYSREDKQKAIKNMVAKGYLDRWQV